MNVIVNVILAVQMLAALAMIGLILIQHGKGADMGAAFGSGASGSLFGATGSATSCPVPPPSSRSFSFRPAWRSPILLRPSRKIVAV